jgi:hypothetical protein
MSIAQLSLAAEIFLCESISTAIVESDFSTMNRSKKSFNNRTFRTINENINRRTT